MDHFSNASEVEYSDDEVLYDDRYTYYTTSIVQDLQLKSAFLRLPFDMEHAEEFEKPDVKIVVQDDEDEFVYAHKLILSRRSPVFCKMFKTKMSEKETGIVRVDDVTLPVMRAVVKFCYDAEITFNDKVTSEDTLKVAHKYEITLLLNM